VQRWRYHTLRESSFALACGQSKKDTERERERMRREDVLFRILPKTEKIQDESKVDCPKVEQRVRQRLVTFYLER